MDLPITNGRVQRLGECQKILAGEGNWTCIKEVLGRNIDMEAGTVALPERKLQELLTLADIPTVQRHMGRNDVDRLVGKLHSIHLAVAGVVAHIYHI